VINISDDLQIAYKIIINNNNNQQKKIELDKLQKKIMIDEYRKDYEKETFK
jgi:hypothetical protein